MRRRVGGWEGGASSQRVSMFALVCLQGNVKSILGKSSTFQALWVRFDSNKQTQKCFVVERVKRDAVITRGALPAWQRPQHNLS